MIPKSDTVLYAEQHADVTELLPSGKLRFIHSGMEFPPNAHLKTLETYAAGKSYRRALARKKNDAYDFEQHLPYIVPHKHRDEKHFLYCTLTKRTLPRQRDVLINHTNGKKFKRRYEEAEKKKKEREEAIANAKRKKALRDKARQGEDAMETDGVHDVLEGLISSDEESGSEELEEENESSTSAEEHDQRTEAKHAKGEDMELSDDGAPVRDKKMGDEMEVETTPVKASPNGVQRTLNGPGAKSSGGRTPTSIKAREFASKKRRRPRTPVPKRVRQPRQKRRTGNKAAANDSEQ